MFYESVTTCEECDLVNKIPPLQDGQRFRCQRCQHVLVSIHKHSSARILGASCAALLMLVLAMSFPFLGFSSSSSSRSVTLFDTIQILLSQDYLVFGILISLALLVFPVVYLFSILYLIVSMQSKRPPVTLQRLLLRWSIVIQPWLMVDVFLVGVLVALVKMSSLADIEFGLSFWAFCGYSVLLLKTVVLVDHRWFWNKVAGPAPDHVITGQSAKRQDLIGCHFCGATLKVPAHYCVRCGHSIHSRRPASLATTLALLIAALIMYIPANVFPIMQTTFWVSFTLEDAEPTPEPLLRSGETVVEAIKAMQAIGVNAILFNCSQPEIIGEAIQLTKNTLDSLNAQHIQIGAYANAFPPQPKNATANEGLDELRKDLTPPAYLTWVKQWHKDGATLIGGCCGIGPEHIAAIAHYEKTQN